LFAAADGVLYDAKRSGRDRVVRLSGVTQTRAPGASPLDALFGPPPSAAPADDTAPDESPAEEAAAATVAAVEPSPPDPRPAPAETAAFAPVLVDPPLGTGTPAEPLLGPPMEPAVEPAIVLKQVPEQVVEYRLQPAVAPRPGTVEPEVVWATGRTTEQVLALVREARREHPDRPALVLRAAAETLVAVASEHDAYTTMDAAAMAAAVGPVPEPVGQVHVLCAGGADGPVAAEAAFVARVAGTGVVRMDDVAGSRIRSLLADGSLFAGADCLIVVAGMDAGLAAEVGAVADVPVVAVPTSTGAPTAFAGLGALMTMLNSAAPGVAVSTIDNGYSAGTFAARVARRAGR
jgi:NCAIR mutase (PurE)-related protein